jgi:hypothetical protein
VAARGGAWGTSANAAGAALARAAFAAGTATAVVAAHSLAAARAAIAGDAPGSDRAEVRAESGWRAGCAGRARDRADAPALEGEAGARRALGVPGAGGAHRERPGGGEAANRRAAVPLRAAQRDERGREHHCGEDTQAGSTQCDLLVIALSEPAEPSGLSS